MTDLRDLAAGQRELDRQKRVKYYQRHLYEFCTEILGYDKLSPTFHGPLLKAWDAIDMRRWKGEMIDTLDLWPRDHIKTWCERARVIRYYLVDPTWTHTWWHAVEDKAEESGVAIGKTIQLNKELRRIWPKDALPAMNAKKFVQSTGFSLRTNRVGEAASFRSYGAGSEATGGHSRGGTMDDINGLNDVQDNQFPAKKRWYEATVCNVIRSNGWKNAIGTRWDPDDTYSNWLKSPYWTCVTRACLETDGKPDYDGEPVYLTREEIDKKRSELGPVMFAYQMMNDAYAIGDRPWDASREQYCTVKEAAERPGTVVTLSDPAPESIGSTDQRAFKVRGDGTKDNWANAALKISRVGDRYDVTLLQGKVSKKWDLATGFEEMCKLGRAWKSTHDFFEASGSVEKLYEDAYRAACRTTGRKYSRRKFEGSNVADAKNVYFGALCSALKSGEFWICESCDDAFVDAFLDEARRWRPMPGGKNALRHDDEANVVSMAWDSAVRKAALRLELEPSEWNPYRSPDKDDAPVGGVRHLRW